MEEKIPITIVIDCDSGDEKAVKEAATKWILENLPTIWEDEDALINNIKVE